MVYRCNHCGNRDRFVEEFPSDVERLVRLDNRFGWSGLVLPLATEPILSIPDLVTCACCGSADVAVRAALLLAA